MTTSIRANSLGTTVLYGFLLAGLTTFVFASVNAGIDPRAHRSGPVDPFGAPSTTWMLVGLYAFIAIIFFDEDSESRRSRATGSKLAYVLDPLPKVLSAGPIFAVFAALVGFFWHAIAVNPGTPGTLWGDYASSPLPAVAMFLLICAAVYFGFALASASVALGPSSPGWSMTFAVLIIVIGIGGGVGFWGLTLLPPLSVLLIAVIALVISVPAFLGARQWAITAHTRKQHDLKRARRQALPQLTSVLRPGERVLIDFGDRTSPRADQLAATTQRILRVSIEPDGRAVVSDEAAPGQLIGASSRRGAGTVITLIHFRDRPDMRLAGGDDSESKLFAEALTNLATHGSLEPR